MYELCAKEPPFNAKTHFDLIQKIKAGRTNPLPTVYSPELKNVIASCLRVDAAKRPDTAQLINLPIIKLMRKEAEVVEIGRQMRSEKSTAARKTKELEEKLASVRTDVEKARHETDERLRREWEVRAQLEIDKRVQEQVRKMNDIFPQEVEKEVQRRLAEYLMEAKNHSQGPSYVRSCTPTKPRSDSTNSGSNSTDAEGDVDSYIPKNAGRSFSTLGEESEFPSQTDLSELSDLHIESPLLSKKPPRPSISNNVPQKRPTRTPFTRAKTMIDNAAMPSPKDVPMVDPSPLPMAALNLSPRRTAPGSQPDFGVPASTNILTAGKNIFATAAASKWEPTNASSVPSSLPSLSDIEDSDADDSNGDEDFENVPVLPSPTRNGDAGDPFKPRGAAPRPRPSIGGMGRQKTMPNTLHRVGAQQRLASAPNLLHQQQQQERLTVANSGAQVKPRPNSAVPVVATSPARKTATVASTSPTRPSPRKTATAPATSNATANGRPTEPQGGIKSKKGMQYEDMIRTAMRNQIQGRTLVELAQARAGGRQIPSQDEVARWDPEKDDMPSPFLKKQVKLVR